jgi:molybdenum-dependent DNA-binding transcriptional regulator ModE
MMRNDLGELSAFAMVAEERSFTRAAARLGVSQSALSHSMRGLEKRLGLQLLARTTRSVSPTAAGAALLHELAPALERIEQAVAETRKQRENPAGRIRIIIPRTATQTHGCQAGYFLYYPAAEISALTLRGRTPRGQTGRDRTQRSARRKNVRKTAGGSVCTYKLIGTDRSAGGAGRTPWNARARSAPIPSRSFLRARACGARPRWTQQQAERMRELRAKLDVGPLSHPHELPGQRLQPVDEVREKSMAAFRGEIERALVLGAEYLVLHPGSWKGSRATRA